MSDRSPIRRVPRIPALIRLLLRLIVPVTEREYLLGDLEEDPVRAGKADGGSNRCRSWWPEIVGALALRFDTRRRRTHRLLHDVPSDTGSMGADTGSKGDGMFAELMSDLRFGLRSMRRNPGFSALGILTLALGIGATTAMFSVVNGVLLSPVPYPEPRRIIQIYESNEAEGFSTFSVSPMNFHDWKERCESFELMTAYTHRRPSLTGRSYPENILIHTVMDDYLEIFGVDIVLGRGFSPDEFDAEAEQVAILRHDFWQRSFGADPEIIGTSITLNGELFTVIGVTGETWQPLVDVDLLVPLRPEAWWATARQSHWLTAMARLRPDATLEQARTELSGIAAALAAEYPDTNTDWDVRLVPLSTVLTGGLQTQLLVLMVAVGLLLLIACTNVANMMLARALTRRTEIGVRMAIGAGRGRVVRQIVTENALFAVFGGVLGIGLAWLGIDIFRNWPGLLQTVQKVTIDPVVLLFALGIALLTGIVSGLLPALNVARSDLQRTIGRSRTHRSGMTARRWGSGLVVAEVALALILLIGSGLLLRSYGLLESEDPGFEHRDRLMFSTWLLDERYSSLEVRRQFADDVRNRLQAHPGVRSVAFSSLIPLSGDDNIWGVRFADEPGTARDEEQFCVVYRVSPGYFRSMGIPIVSGHDFTSADGPDTRPVALLSESIARQHFGDEEPEGRRFIMGDETYSVIGVVGDVQHYSLGQASPRPQVYLLYAQNVVRSVSFVLHASVPPQTLAQTARDAVLAVDPDQPVVELQTLDQLVGSTIEGFRFRTLLLACFAGVALLLAVAGLYGVMSFAVSQRTHEIGVRIALGAHTGSVLALIVRNGLVLVLIGTGLGVIAAGSVAGLLESFLFGISARDPGIFIGAPLVLIVTALVATLVPARRATRVDPIRALVRE